MTEAAEDLQLEPSWKCYSANSVRFGSVGSFPVRGFVPFCAVEDTSHGVTWAAATTQGSSWQMELYRQDFGLSLSGGVGRPGVRRMVQDPCPRRVLHRAQSGADRRVQRCGHGGAGAGRKTPAAPSSRFCPHRKRPCLCCSTSFAPHGASPPRNRPAPCPRAERQKLRLLRHLTRAGTMILRLKWPPGWASGS